MTTDHWFMPSLWPGGHEEVWGLTARHRCERYVAVPSRSEVHQLLPWRWSSAVAASRRVSDDRSRFSLLRDSTGAAALLVLAALSPSRRLGVRTESSMTDHLASELGLAASTLATVLFGPARANRKPVIQLHDRRGRTSAWVKVATNDLTRALLAREVAVLGELHDRSGGFRVPAVLGTGTFGEASWAALQPMTVDRRRRPDLATFDHVATAIERTAPRWTGPIEDSPLLARLIEQARGLDAASPIVTRLAERHRGRDVELGAAHGDLVPWNMLSGTPAPAVWDWERYETTAPIGFDRIHRRVQVAVQKLRHPLERAIGDTEAALSGGHRDLTPDGWSLQIDCYLAVMLCRYEGDAERHDNPRLAGRIRDLTRVLNDRGATS